MRLLFIVALVVSALFALTSACGDQTYADLKQACNETMKCKNFLTCTNGYCIEPSYRTNCTGNASLCGSAELYCYNGYCDVKFRENRDYCAENAQCLSNNCINDTCTGNATLGTPCDLANYAATYECAADLFCLPDTNGTQSCQKPLNGTDCTDAINLWNSNSLFQNFSSSLFPQGICVPGSACLLDPSTNRSSCAVLFNTSADSPCQRRSVQLDNAPTGIYSLDLGCHYNMTCAPLDGNGTLVCTNGTEKAPKNCSAFDCPFGEVCGCVPGSKNSCNTYVFGDVCEPLLSDLMACVRKNGCAYRPSTLPQQDQVFAGLSYAPWCVSRKCGIQHQRFLCCQNNQTELGSGEFPYTPLRLPKQNGYCNLDNGWPNWVVPVIVLGGIVLVVAVIVALYLVVRRKPDADYDPINK